MLSLNNWWLQSHRNKHTTWNMKYRNLSIMYTINCNSYLYPSWYWCVFYNAFHDYVSIFYYNFLKRKNPSRYYFYYLYMCTYLPHNLRIYQFIFIFLFIEMFCTISFICSRKLEKNRFRGKTQRISWEEKTFRFDRWAGFNRDKWDVSYGTSVIMRYTIFTLWECLHRY